MEAAFSIPIGAALGWLADRMLGTDPAGLLVGIGFGFAACIVRLLRMRNLVEEEAAAAPKQPPGGAGGWDDDD